MKQNCGEVKQESGGVVIPTWLFWLMLVNAILFFANLFFDLIKGNGDRGAATVYGVEKREWSDRDEWREAKGVTLGLALLRFIGNEVDAPRSGTAPAARVHTG